jgi:DNA-binding beta-propeller fold protein YncE
MRVFIALLLLSGFSATAQKPEKLGKIESDKIAEASGLAASTILKGCYWTHNDSGNKPEVYLINSKGELLSTIKVKGFVNRDWEDIAEGVGPDPRQQYVYVGDIGNNIKLGIDVMVLRFPVPATVPAKKAEVKPDYLYLRYPDGPRDAETLMVDPVSRHLYVISKREKQVSLYKVAQLDFKSGETAKMEKVLTLPYNWITAGDISRDGYHIIIKNDKTIYYWHRQKGESIEAAMAKPATILPYTPEKQGEGLTFKPDNSGYLTISEGKNPILYYYPHQF